MVTVNKEPKSLKGDRNISKTNNRRKRWQPKQQQKYVQGKEVEQGVSNAVFRGEGKHPKENNLARALPERSIGVASHTR